VKIRIQDNSIRFRLTVKETEILERDRRLDCSTEIPGLGGSSCVFGYSIIVDQSIAESEVRIGPASIAFALCLADARDLFDPTREGVYVRREWIDSGGGTKRFLAFAEKDRPGSTCVKAEEWICDMDGGRPARTVSIPKPK
jgi:hypothetical protein